MIQIIQISLHLQCQNQSALFSRQIPTKTKSQALNFIATSTELQNQTMNSTDPCSTITSLVCATHDPEDNTHHHTFSKPKPIRVLFPPNLHLNKTTNPHSIHISNNKSQKSTPNNKQAHLITSRTSTSNYKHSRSPIYDRQLKIAIQNPRSSSISTQKKKKALKLQI